jgi:hypothetical protein
VASRWVRVGALTTVVVVVVAVVALLVVRPWSDEPPDSAVSMKMPAGAVTIMAAGDIGRCDDDNDDVTAALVRRVPDATVLALGDLAYDDGTARDFEQCYDPSWGEFRSRTRPVPGNHEYKTPGAAPYFDYFGSIAGTPEKGWYSFDLGAWHIVALNSNCSRVGCEAGSEQERWLRDDLRVHGPRCTLAFWHHPRFSSGVTHGGSKSVQDLWQALMDNDVELALSGHEHLYERTAPLDARGKVDDAHGVRQFVVGTGGGNFYELGETITGSEAAFVETSGVMRMVLRTDGYDWRFLPGHAEGKSDTGSAACR